MFRSPSNQSKILPIAVLTAIFAIAGHARDASADELSLADTKTAYEKSTVFIAIKYRSLDGATPTSGCSKGSGVVISPDGYVVTSHHLFTDEKNRPFESVDSILGKLGENFDCDAPLGDVIKLNQITSIVDVDASLLKLESAKTFKPVTACLNPKVQDGSTLYALGFPLGLPLAPKSFTKATRWANAGN